MNWKSKLGQRALVVALAVVAGTSCRLTKTSEPSLTGPSMFGVSLALSATPDLLQRDGRTTSAVTISAFDGSSRPVPGLGLHLDLRLDGGTGGLGTLSQSNVTTGADGKATVTYTSPLQAPLGHSDEATVSIIVTPVGSNSQNTTSWSVSLQLTSPNQVGGPTATFVMGPVSPKVGDTILFDASASLPSAGSSITTFAWDFGDGNANPRVPYLVADGPTITHEYNKSGPFTVGLTIIDTSGRRATATLALFLQ